MSWNDVEKTKSGGGEYYSLEQGENKVRLLSDPVRVMKLYDPATKKSKIAFANCGYSAESKPRWIAYVLNYRNNQIELGEFAHSIMKQVLEYKNNEDYAFETSPMPYDITIKKTGELLDTEYTVMPARQNSDIDPAILDELKKKKTCSDIKQAWQEKQLKELAEDPEWVAEFKARQEQESEQAIEYPDDDINPEDIPF